MKYIKLLALFALALCAGATSAGATVIYNDSGYAGPGSAAIITPEGPTTIYYDEVQWSGYYDDEGSATYSYTMYTENGPVSVVGSYGGLFGPGWSFWGNSDELDANPPAFLAAFWAAFP